MNEKILVLGSTGLLGKIATNQLVNDGFIIKTLVRNQAKAKKIFSSKVEIIQGDITKREELKNALKGCEKVHISLSYPVELTVVKHIVSLAKELSINKISYISGSTVKKENIFFPVIKDKFDAEELLKKSGVNYQIFKPTFFEESLERFVVKGRASILGKQENPYHIASAKQFSKLVSSAFRNDENMVKSIFGDKAITLNEALLNHCKKNHPEIKKVSNLPYFMANVISFLSGDKALKETAKFFAYFEKVGENYSETN